MVSAGKHLALQQPCQVLPTLTTCSLTPKQICAHFQISPRTLGYWQKRYNLPRIKVGKTVRYRLEEVEAALREHTPTNGVAV